MSILTEKRYTLDEAAKKLRMSRATFDRCVRPKLKVIQHSKRFVEVPEQSLEDYLREKLNTPSTAAAPTKKAAKRGRK